MFNRIHVVLALALCLPAVTLADDHGDAKSRTCSGADLTTDGTSNGIPDGSITLSDFSYYLLLWNARDERADLTTTGVSNGIPDDQVDLSDFSFYVGLWCCSCP